MPNESHVRIDEGIKKGPRKPRKPRNTIKARDAKTGQALSIIPKDLKPETVLARYLGDERTADIAASFNVTRPALNMWLLDHAEDGWKKAQIARAVSRKESAEDEIEDAADPLTLARAREKLRGAQWDLERVFNRIYGQKQEVTHTGTVTVTHALQAIAERRQGRIVADTQQDQPIIDVAPEQQLLDGK